MTMKLKELIEKKTANDNEEDIINDIVLDIISEDDFKTLSFIQKKAIAALRECGGIANEDFMTEFNNRTMNSLVKKGIIEKTVTDTTITYHLLDLTADKEPEDSCAYTLQTDEFRKTCEKVLGGWGWQGRLAKAIGVHKNTVAKWAAGRLEVPIYVTALIESLEVIKDAKANLPERFQK